MKFIEQLSLEMQRNENIMTFSQIGGAITRGAIAGARSGVPGGVVIGATLALSIEATDSAIKMAQDLILKPKRTNHLSHKS